VCSSVAQAWPHYSPPEGGFFFFMETFTACHS
jgi:hypothetical protein